MEGEREDSEEGSRLSPKRTSLVPPEMRLSPDIVVWLYLPD